MTAFPEPLEAPTPDPWEQANESDRAKAEQRIQGAATGEDFVPLLKDADPVVRVAAARAIGDRLSSVDDTSRRDILNVLESETIDAVWRPLMSALLTATPASPDATLKGLKAIAVLDPSDRKRSAALVHLVDPEGGALKWASEFVRERMFSDESNHVRATAAARAVESSADSELATFATQWLKHADLVPPGLAPDHTWHDVEKDDDYFVNERRALLADDRGVRTTRSRATTAADDDGSSSTRRTVPTLVQGHSNEASLAIKAQRILAAVAAVGGTVLVVVDDARAALGLGLVALAVVWAIGLQVWKWYRYG